MKKIELQFKKYGLYVIGILCIFIATYITGMHDIELPGVYFDAVYPDYLAAVGAFPGINNFTQITQHVGLPLLGNFYHGTFSAAVQFIVLKCVGHASVYTLRLTNLFYIAIIGAILFAVSYKLSRKWVCSLLPAFICVTSQNALAHTRTQYFIMLPGVIFFLLSLSILFWNLLLNEETKQSWFVAAGIFQGLAFYVYFSFLLLVPASLILIFRHESVHKRRESTFCYIWSVVLGSILYFYGYLDSLLVNLFGFSTIAKILLILGCVLITLVLCFPILVVLNPRFKHYKRNIFIIYMVAALIGIIAICCTIIHYIGNEKFIAIKKMIAMSQNRNSGSRLLQYWNLLFQVLTNDCSQFVIFHEKLYDIGCGYVLICGCLSLVAFIIYSNKKLKHQQTSDEIEIVVLYDLCMYVVIFYITSLPIVMGMQPQHLIVVYYIISLMSTMGLCYIVSIFFNKYIKMGLLIGLLIVGVIINIKNDSVFFKELEKNGGQGSYSTAYNDFAKMAYEDENKDTIIYVFPQWNFYANFVYLTSNSCQAIRNADIQIGNIQDKINSGYIIVIVGTDQNVISDISTQLHYKESKQKSWKSLEGDEVFVSLEISK